MLHILWTAERAAMAERATWTRAVAARGRENAARRFMVGGVAEEVTFAVKGKK